MNKKWLDVLQASYEKNQSSFTNVTVIDGMEASSTVEKQIVAAIQS